MDATLRNSFGTGGANGQTGAPGRVASRLARVFVLFVSLTGLGAWSGNALAVAKVASAGANWATATWTPAGVPTAGDTCTINSGVNLSVTTAATCGALTIGNATNSNTTLTLAAGGSLNITTTGGQTGNLVLNPSNLARTFTIATATQTLTVGGTFTTGTAGTNRITVSTGQVTFTRAAGLTWPTLGTLTITGNPSVGASATFAGPLTQAGGTIQNTGGTASILTFNGGYTKSGGTFTTRAGETINFGGNLTVSTVALTFNATSIANFTNAATITPTAAITFGNLTIASGANTVTLAGNVAVASNLSVNSGTLDLSTFTADRTAAGGTLTVANGATLRIGSTNTFPANYTAHTLGTTSTVEYSGTNQSVAAEVPPGYGNLTLSGSGTKTAASSFITRGGLTITGVTFAGTTFTHTVNGNVSNTGTHTATSGSITLSGGAAVHTLSGNGTYANLILNDVNGATLGGSPTVSGTLTLTAGTFAAGANTLTLTGPTIAGTPANLSTTSSSSLVFGGASVGVLVPGSVGALNNLTINNTNGISLGGSAVTTTLSGTLALAANTLTTGTNIVALAGDCSANSGNGSVTRTSGYVIGYLQLTFPTAALATTCIYHVGDSIGYAPVTVALTGATAGTLTSRVDSGDHPDTIANLSGIDQTKSANRYWTLTPGTLATYTSYDATFQFGAAIDATATTGNFIVAKKNLGAWIRPTVGTRTATTTPATGITLAQGFGAFAVGEPLFNVYKGVNKVIDLHENY